MDVHICRHVRHMRMRVHTPCNTTCMHAHQRVRGDRCQFGQVSEAGNPVRKATGCMSKADCLLDVLNRRCFGRHGFCSRDAGGRHQDCIGKTARRAAIYSDQMCETILAGMRAQLKADGRARDGEVGVHCVMDDGDDEVAKVTQFAGGARRGPMSDLLCVKPSREEKQRFILPTENSGHGTTSFMQWTLPKGNFETASIRTNSPEFGSKFAPTTKTTAKPPGIGSTRQRTTRWSRATTDNKRGEQLMLGSKTTTTTTLSPSSVSERKKSDHGNNNPSTRDNFWTTPDGQ